jgi:integrase
VRIYRRGKIFWAQYRGERFSLHTTDREAAELAFKHEQRTRADPDYRPPDTTPLSVAIDAFAAQQLERKRAPETIRRTGASRDSLVAVLGDVPISSVDATALDRFMSVRTADGAKPLTIARELQAFSGAYKIALRRGVVTKPLEAIMPALDLDYRPLDRALKFDEIDKLRAELKPHRAAVVGFIVATAADWRSVTLAQRADVTADAVLVRGTKNARRWRTLPVLPAFREWLEAAREHLPFTAWGNAVRDIRAACRRASIPEVTPRDLRRSTAKILRALGVEPSLIAAFMGHADSRMVERVYGRLAPAELGALVLAQAVQKRHESKETQQV